MSEIPFVLDSFFALSPGAVASIRTHVIRSAEGMAGIVSQTQDGNLTLHSIQELKDYCYIVAGIVGEMLSELFLLDRPALAGVADVPARARGDVRRGPAARQHPEGLRRATRRRAAATCPPKFPSHEVFALARKDLGIAGDYILALQKAGAPRGLVEFTALPVRLAWAALERVEKSGPGSKVSRPEVFLIVQKLKRALDRGEPAV